MTTAAMRFTVTLSAGQHIPKCFAAVRLPEALRRDQEGNSVSAGAVYSTSSRLSLQYRS